jgi:hypothetical protein
MAIKNGTATQTVSGMAKALSSTSVRVRQLLVQALPTNAGPVFVGDSTTLYSGVSGGGIFIPTPTTNVPAAPITIIPAGGTSVADLKDLYINSVTGLPGINFIYDEF